MYYRRKFLYLPPLFLFTLLLFLLLPGYPAFSEISPREYALMQINAPEELIIEVISVKRKFVLFKQPKPIVIIARIEHVLYSETELQEDDTIIISYDFFSPKGGWAGPRPIPVLETGEFYPAFLQFSEETGCYFPAARGASFESRIPLD